MNDSSINDFEAAHKSQLDALNIPAPLHSSLQSQLEACLVENDTGLDCLRLVTAPEALVRAQSPSEYGSMIVLPHVVEWDMVDHGGFWQALSELDDSVLRRIYRGLKSLWNETEQEIEDRETLLDAIYEPRTWSRVILFRSSSGTVRGALPAPPYYPQVSLESSSDLDTKEADLTGPFPFQYHLPKSGRVVDTSLAYLSPDVEAGASPSLPTMNLVPKYSCPNTLTRSVRYAALLQVQAPPLCVAQVKQLHADFVQQMHFVRQQALERREHAPIQLPKLLSPPTIDIVYKVYTDANDPMELAHAEAGLTDPHFMLTGSIEEADIVYSFRSLFAPGPLKESINNRLSDPTNTLLINQFPYEGAFVQKDHLGRELLKQHGLPRPSWAIETYDLDVQLGEFIGAAILAAERGEDPVWIVKPARGTQSKGHLVTRSTAHILRLVDAGGESRVVQRYIERPICYDDRKIDCRCIVMMTDAQPGRPTLFVHKRVYFRIANKPHTIDKPSDCLDLESVLTANHLLDSASRTTTGALMTLPVDYKTIAKLEEDYAGKFDWNGCILPQIYTMIRELFSGMTEAFPAMGASRHSRALYGVDVMFDTAGDTVVPKLTEVTFCPANNAVCDAYERDEDLYRSYNNDVFNCLFRSVVSENIIQLQ